MEEQRKFKEERLPHVVNELAQTYPDAEIEIWAQDEHRVGLQPIIRGVWVNPKTSKVTVPVHPRYKWFYLYAFVHPASGRSYWWILPCFDKERFLMVLKDFAQEYELGPSKRVIVVLDGAGAHRFTEEETPEGIHLLTLPSYSPELQPAERLWRLSDEPLANRIWNDVEEMKDEAWRRCDFIRREMKEEISSLTNYHWWPEDIIRNN